MRKVVTSRAGGFRLSVHKGFPSWTAAGYHYPTEITRILCGCRRIHSRTSVHCLARLLDCSASRCCQLGICPVMPLWPLFTRILNLPLHAAAATAIAEGSGRRPPLYDLRLAVVRARRPRAALAASAEGRQHGQAENQAPHCGILRCSRADERDGFRSSVSLFWTHGRRRSVAYSITIRRVQGGWQGPQPIGPHRAKNPERRIISARA